MKHLKALTCALALCGSGLALAESEFSIYGGSQTTPHSTVTGSDGRSFYTSWQGVSFEMPVYYGLRYTDWVGGDWGYAVNFTHAKAKANPVERSAGGYSVLEFTDGANPLTVMALRRFDAMESGLRPYVGAGLGVTFPHVEVQKTGSSDATKTFGYQYGGPALTAAAGFNYPINDQWNLMTEFQVHYLKFDVRVDGGRLKTNLVTNAINIGAVYRF
ncbi:MAG: hypothetical protein RI998_305 [Pseudomonadota bacterium]|jgi:lipid A oxidase